MSTSLQQRETDAPNRWKEINTIFFVSRTHALIPILKSFSEITRKIGVKWK